MEIPEICTRAAPRVRRKRKAEFKSDPDYNPTTGKDVKGGRRSVAKTKPGLLPIKFDTGTSSSISPLAGSSGSNAGLLLPNLGSSTIKPWEERRVVRRSKVLESERKKPAPELHYIEREQYSIENWKEKAENSKKKREALLKSTSNTKKAETKGSQRNAGVHTGKSGVGLKEYNMENETFEYKLLDPIASELDPLVKFLHCSDLNSKNFNLTKLPYFLMGTGKGEPGGPPAFEFNSLWNYELDPLSPNDTEETIDETRPWRKDPTVADFEPRVLSIVAVFSVGRHLDLNVIAHNCRNIEYNPARCAPLIMRIRKPKSTALIFASGRIIVTGTKSMDDCKLAARKYTRSIQRIGFNVKVLSFTIQNVSAQCHFPFRVRIHHLARNKIYGSLSYEPELFPGLIIPLEFPRVKVIIFCTGSVLFTGARSTEDVDKALKIIYPLVKMYGH